MFYRLLFAHLLADFVLQNTWMVKHKWHWPVLWLHTSTVLVCLVLVTGEAVYSWWPWFFGITVAHGLIDWAKLRLDRRWRQSPIVSFLADQAAHLLILAGAVVGAGGPDALLQTSDFRWGIASLYLVCTFAASIALPTWLNPISVMRRPYLARFTTIITAGIVLTCTWRGYGLAALLAGGGMYLLLSQQHHATNQTSYTQSLEVLTASALSAIAGWILNAVN